MTVNEVPSNKTYTDLYGDHMNNVVVFGDDSRADKFYAHVKLEFWGEDWITLEKESSRGEATLSDDKITLDDASLKMEWYQDKKITGLDTWSSTLKWIVIYKEKPPENGHFLKLGGGWKEFDFIYNTPFPDPISFMKDGKEWLRQDIIPGYPGFNHRRPREIDGSLAVYHKSKRNHIIGGKNYRTGKALHIPVPMATDAVDKTEWGKLAVIDGYLKVSFSEKFLNEAVYPIVVNDRFGYWSIGGTPFGQNADKATGYKETCPAAGTADSISIYSGAEYSGNFKGMLMNNSGTLLANGVGNAAAYTPSGWFTSAFSTPPDVAGSTEYAIGGITDSNINLQYDGGTNSWYDVTNSYASPENCDLTNWDAYMSIYCTYTPAAGANAPTGVLSGSLVGSLGGPV